MVIFTYLLVRKSIDRITIYKLISIVLLCTSILCIIYIINSDKKLFLLPINLLLFISALSNFLRAFAEARGNFFSSLSLKVIFNSLLAILLCFFYQKTVAIFLLCTLYFFILIYLVRKYFQDFLAIPFTNKDALNLNKYFGFLMQFFLVVTFFYFDRFFILFFDNYRFIDFTLQFEQLIKLALPINLGIMFLTPKISDDLNYAYTEIRTELLYFFIFLVLYSLASPYFYYFLGGYDNLNYTQIFISTIGIGTFLVSIWLAAIFSINNLLFFLVIFFPILIISIFINLYSLNIPLSLLCKGFSALIFVIIFISLENKKIFGLNR